MFFSNRKMQVTYLSEFTGPISPPFSIFKVYRVNIFNKVILSKYGVQILFFFILLPILTWPFYLKWGVGGTVLLQSKCSDQIKLKGLIFKFEC